MLQRTAGAFIVNKIKDELLSPPRDDEEEAYEEQPAHAQVAHCTDDDPQDGAEYRDEEGRLIGYMRRVASVQVYAVTSAHGSPHAALADALRDPESELVFQTTDGRISGLVYIPSPNAAKASQTSDTRGFRADDV